MNWSSVLATPVTKKENDLLNRQAEYFRKNFVPKNAEMKFCDLVQMYLADGIHLTSPIKKK